jgi:hypothetical protein
MKNKKLLSRRELIRRQEQSARDLQNRRSRITRKFGGNRVSVPTKLAAADLKPLIKSALTQA